MFVSTGSVVTDLFSSWRVVASECTRTHVQWLTVHAGPQRKWSPAKSSSIEVGPQSVVGGCWGRAIARNFLRPAHALEATPTSTAHGRGYTLIKNSHNDINSTMHCLYYMLQLYRYIYHYLMLWCKLVQLVNRSVCDGTAVFILFRPLKDGLSAEQLVTYRQSSQ